jgi:penicillin amidase
MNKFAKTFLGSLIIIVPLILILGLLFNNLSEKSFYQTSGELPVNGLKSPVKVYFDDFGVPQLIAQNEEDAYFTMGFIHARDRLWQMDLNRRVAEGRLSEIFGSSTVDFDKLFKTIGIGRFSYSWYNSIEPKSKEILTNYTAGVNRFIEMHYDNLPVEFDALNYKPEPWKPENSLMLARMMAWDLNIAWYTDYIIGELVNKVGLEKTAEIFPDSNITIFKKPEPLEEDSTSESNRKGISEIDNYRISASLGKDFITTFSDYRKFMNLSGSHIGSNSWVVSSSHSSSGKPILANDPHLALQAPSRWYELYVKGGGLDVRGMTVPGVPGVVIGNNNHCAWGLSNLMNDDNDYIILNKDSSDNSKYIYNNQSLKPDSLIEKIYVKDSLEIDYVIWNTKSGPVVSDLNIRGFADLEPVEKKIYNDKLLSFKWTGYELSDEVYCFYKINTSKNWEEFRAALKDFGVPAQNFIYADTAGNIGYQAAGKIPLRKAASINDYIYPNSPGLEWTGFVEFENLPSVYNPPEGYIVTANTDPYSWLKSDKEKYYISYLWEPASRFSRIKDFLTSRSVFDTDDFRLLQNNFESPYAKNINRHLVNSYKDQSISDDNIRWCVERFTNWNGEMNSNESIGTIYNTFLVYLLKNIYEDELGANVFNDFLTIQNIPYRSLELILQEGSAQEENSWFNNVNTVQKESKDQIIRQSLEQAIEFLKTKFTNQDINTWNWGELHKVKFRHPLGMVEALDKTFNIGPFDIGGDQTTVNNTEYRFEDVISKGEFNVVVGPSMRMIVDLADMKHAMTINSTGQSGQPLNRHYGDQSRMWTFGEYKINTVDEFEMNHKKYDLLILLPAN